MPLNKLRPIIGHLETERLKSYMKEIEIIYTKVLLESVAKNHSGGDLGRDIEGFLGFISVSFSRHQDVIMIEVEPLEPWQSELLFRMLFTAKATFVKSSKSLNIYLK